MVSKTKYEMDEATIRQLFDAAGIHNASGIAPLGAGEYNAVYAAQANGKEYVLKVAPKEELPVLTYETNIMKSELYWYEQIAKHTSIRVPEIYFTDFTREIVPVNYYIMERLAGTPMNQMKFTPEEKKDGVAQLAKMAAEIHTIKNEKAGYIQNQLYDNWYQAIRAFVQALLKDCERMGKTSKSGEKLLLKIEEHRSLLEQVECTMVNFDIHSGNIVCTRENGAVQYAWIDPERSFWGDPIADFANLEMLTPLEKKSTSLAAYNAIASAPITLSREEKIRYGISMCYLSLIMETEKYFRYSRSHFGWWRNVVASKALFAAGMRSMK